MRRLLLLSCVWACSNPPPPELPGRDRTGPAELANKDCAKLMPYPTNFGQAEYVWADLDRAELCTVYVEQDDCVVAIWRDCAGDSREWQGRVAGAGASRMLHLESIYANNGARPARAPSCCEGPILPADREPDEAILSCGLQGCGIDVDKKHLGIQLERKRSGGGPTLGNSLTLGPTGSKIVASANLGDSLWVLVQGPEPGIYGQNGERLATIEGQAMVAGHGAFYVAQGRTLSRVEPSGAVSATFSVSSTIAHLAVLTDGILLGTADELVRFNSTISVPQRRPVTGLTGLIGLPRVDEPAAVAFFASKIETITSTLGRKLELDLAKDTVRDLTHTLPQLGFAIDANTVGFAGKCNLDDSGKRCFFEARLEQPLRLERTALPQGSLQALAVSATGDRIVAVSDQGLRTFLRGPLRPELQHTLDLAGQGLAVISGVWWVTADQRATAVTPP